MSIKCNDTQLVLLSAASQRDDHCLVPPAGPKRAQAQRTRLPSAGWKLTITHRTARGDLGDHA